MEKSNHSKQLKIFLPIVIIAFSIAIFKKGYAFGQWLFAYLH